MSFLNILSTLLIGPLKLLFEIIFVLANSFTNHPGYSIIFLSLAMNILVLPLYRRADAMQEEARDTEARLHDGVAHIKKTFSGDEKMMMLQTYYRQNNYKTTDALHGSVSLLLEIPFFMAAYQFLSHLQLLNGISFGPIADLGKPDGILVIGALSVNLLPILMTAINVISSVIYLRGFPLKTKIQLYTLAAFFLVFLYQSPAGLVFYWTLNNLFSLCKNIFYKIKNPKRAIAILSAAAGIGLMLFTAFGYRNALVEKRVFLVLLGGALFIPGVLHFVPRKNAPKVREYKPNRKNFLGGALFLSSLIGVLIPATYISASPEEYFSFTGFYHPLWYIVSSACMAFGTFLIWFAVFYWLASPKGKVLFERILWIFSGVAVVNYMFFGTKLGVISTLLQYDGGLNFSVSEHVWNIVVLLLLIAALAFLFWKVRKIVAPVLLIASVAFLAMSVMHIHTIRKDVSGVTMENPDGEPTFNLSTEGQNVVIIMLDRAMGEYVPYMFNELPELKTQFDGFTYYQNTLAYGGHTNFAASAFFGGYEYTPVEMNKRDTELMVDKHNEALKVMPQVFIDQGYEVTFMDPTYANYEWTPDLSIFDGMDMKTYITKGHFADPELEKDAVAVRTRNFFCFGLMKTLPVGIQNFLYGGGTYLRSSASVISFGYGDRQEAAGENLSIADGVSGTFLKSYNVLANLSGIGKITKEKKNTFMILTNDITHDETMLSAPSYTPAEHVDNTAYDKEHADRFTVDGKTLSITTQRQMESYHVNISAMITLGKWFDYLREQGVYNNTKIIIASDHGFEYGTYPELLLDESNNPKSCVERFLPLLMVKDFGAKGFTTSTEFMTNADIPTIAFAGSVDQPVNPFTKKAINSDEKTAHDQFVILSQHFTVADYKKAGDKTFPASGWVSIGSDGNVYDRDSWTYHKKNVLLKEHSFD